MNRKHQFISGLVVLALVLTVALVMLSRPETERVSNTAEVEQRAGDPIAGKQQLLSGNYVSCGLPERVYRKLVPIDDALLLPDREGSGSDLPYFNNRVQDADGNALISNNCLTCHAAPFAGEIVIGLGNEFLDFTSEENSIEKAGLLVRGEAETKAWQKIADRMAAVAPYTRASTQGVNVANNLTYALMAHFDPATLAWSNEPLIEPPDHEPLPVSVPPWWRMQKKTALFYQGQGQGDHARIMILAALLCAEGVEEVEQADKAAVDIRAYIASLQAPEYPYPVDSTLVAAGEAVFVQTCAECHGTYGSDEQYPNKIVPLDVVGTDPQLALQAFEYDRFNQWFEQSWYGVDSAMVPVEGYMAPSLDGVWATGPFLHNGSVPSIALLLNSQLRPTQWRHSTDKIFDTDNLGWRWEAIIDKGEAGANPTAVYDTQRLGYGNGGHLFGDHLTTEQRAAVLEYLKTL